MRQVALTALCLFGAPVAGWAQCNQLVWADEFNTPGDLSKWQVYEGDGCNVGNCNFGNAELQAYRAANATVTGGFLNIATRYENTVVGGRTYNYTSAKLQSKTASGALQTFKYGKIEARMKLPSAQGIWPAFWMLADPGNWPYTGEIDIMEAKHKNPKSVAGTIHYDAGGWHFTGREYSGTVDLSADFHVYTIEWGPDQIKWFVDGTLYHTASPETTFGNAWPFNTNNYYLILNTAVGGPGTPFTGNTAPNPADYPSTTQVDYVRVYTGPSNYAVYGDGQVYQGEQGKTYRLDAITGATYNWSVPSGATITSGQGTNSIQVNWGNTGGTVTASVAVNGCAATTYTKAVTVSAPLQLDRVYEDYEANRALTYGTMTGVLTQATANPAAVAPNTSAKVGRYVRNGSEQYDVLYVRGLTVSNASDFAAGRRKVYMDVYSTAPVGSKITMQFENSRTVLATNYPTGRQSSYFATTSRQNAWETLEFDFEKVIDAGTSVYDIDNVVFLFQPGITSGATFYLDNILVKKKPDAAVVATDILENYDGTSRITFDATLTNGAYTPAVANPSATAPNTSAKVARYVRNSVEQYDVLFFTAGTPGSVIEDASLFKDQTNQILVDVYTSAPVGTPVVLNLQNKAAAAGSYPAGRNSSYEARTTKQNGWETLTFSYTSSPDAGTANVSIDQLAFLFANNSRTGDTYYVDNIRVAKYAAPPTYTAGTVFEDYEATHNLTFLSADGTYTPTVANPSAVAPNTSARVGRYARNATATYDVLAFRTNSIKDGSAYKKGDKVFAIDLYTTAPVGTVISCQLENVAQSNTGNYPTGRHSIYQAAVKQTNAWHTLTFTFASAPDLGTPDIDVDKLVFLFAPNSTTSATYHIDNIRSLVKTGTTPTNAVPTVSLTSPTSGATFAAPASITISANAADSDGAISKVEFYNGTTLLNTDTTSPYSYTWTGVAAGTYSITAKATDNANATTTSSAVSVTVNGAGNTAPTVSITAPANNSSFTAPASVNITANAADADGTITKVEFYNGTTLLGTDTASPYSFSWTGVAAGTYSITAKATDNGGAVTTSAAVNVTVTGAPTGTNLALNKPTTTSSTEAPEMSGALAVDGNATTRWASAFADPQWIYVDLGARYNVSQVKLSWEAAYGKDYLVQVSNDAASWTTVKTVTSNTTLTNDHTGLSGAGRYVRIYGTARGTTYGYSLYELEVYGTPASTSSTVCGGTVTNGDYRYEVSTANGTVSWKFVPLTPIAGSNMALLYVKVGSGGYAGYNMTASGSDFVFSQPQAAGAALSFYFTYRVGTTGTERNSSATPHSYTVGSTCTTPQATLAATTAKGSVISAAYPNPVTNQLTIELRGNSAHQLTVTDARGAIVRTLATPAGTSIAQLNLAQLPGGVYFLTVQSGSGVEVQKIMKN
ncbi:Ig-like domain-containing protein [Hymenobacter cellulosivorans]|uniref:Ig-like domain-containing protein n=1 Tax=Hymenobacter cellulosivorans TaxID=2932249 RepID=A0ABY4FCQ5_9BACT|nr:Ig-like domain-containing protein [Hymenobacter cellulosivorans]UOQ53941.1 Ig-like domain-containing protein [Hymenobacter cellulosivorans]